jgi:hypothetical protein
MGHDKIAYDIARITHNTKVSCAHCLTVFDYINPSEFVPDDED